MIIIWHWDNVSVSEQEEKEIIKNIILWSNDILKSWDKNEIEV